MWRGTRLGDITSTRNYIFCVTLCIYIVFKILSSCCAVSASRSVDARLKSTEFASEKQADFAKAMLAGLRLVGNGLALWERLQQPQYLQKNAEIAEDASAVVKQSVSLLCERVCEVALQRAQADVASKSELVAAEVYVALSAVLEMRVGLTR